MPIRYTKHRLFFACSGYYPPTPPRGVYLMLGIYVIPTIRYPCLYVKYLLTLGMYGNSYYLCKKLFHTTNHKL